MACLGLSSIQTGGDGALMSCRSHKEHVYRSALCGVLSDASHCNYSSGSDRRTQRNLNGSNWASFTEEIYAKSNI